MRLRQIPRAVAFVFVTAVVTGLVLGATAGQPAVRAAPPARPAAQGVQVSGFVQLGGGTCNPDAVLTDCGGTVIAQLKGPGGSGFFTPYVGLWADISGAQQTCPAGDTYLDVVTIQPATSPCQTPTPGPSSTPGGPTVTSTPTVVAPTATPGGVVDVAMRDNVFDPVTINIPAGTTVRWTNQGLNAHTSTSDTGLWDSGTVNPGGMFTFTFISPGTYTYHCQFHRALGMTGTVVVTGGAAQPSPTPPGAPANLARGRAVQAYTSQPGFPPEQAVDGSGATFWASAAGRDPYAWARNTQWIYVDLGNTYAVKKMHMLWTAGRHPWGYTIYAWLDFCGGWCRIASTTRGDGDDLADFPEEVEARYWMLWLVNPYLMGSHYELIEWEIEGVGSTVQTTNVAAGKPAVSLNHQPGFEAAKVSDGDAGTEWRSFNLPVWIYVDLQTTEEVDRAILRWTAGQHATSYMIYVWSGWGWQPIYYTTRGAGGDETAIFPAVRGQYFLLYATAGPAGTVGLREFELYRRRSGSGLPTPLLDGDWRWLRGAGEPDVVPEGVARPPAVLGSAPGSAALELDRSKLPNPQRTSTD